MRRIAAIALLAVVAASCGAPAVDPAGVPDLVAITPAEMRETLAASDRPVVVNVWASWCAPCRSEAPLLRTAADKYGDRVRFIGIDVRDTQTGARGFIAEFALTGFEHRFDAAGAVPADLGGVGVPITYFFRPGGELAHRHNGVIDERTLALWLADLTAAG